MNKVIAYSIVSTIVLLACILAVSIITAISIAMVMFVTWSMPSVLITAHVLRLVALFSTLLAAAIMSVHGKEMVKGFINGYNRKRL
jgi:hypothetical protein